MRKVTLFCCSTFRLNLGFFQVKDFKFRCPLVSKQSFLTALFPFLGLIDSSLWSNVKISRRSKNRDPSEMKECPICRVWTNKKNFARHMHVHSDLRAFRCKICDKGFKTRLNLTRHESIHTRDSAT